MILCLDCGNTRLKWGLNENGRWLEQGALPVAEIGRLRQVLSSQPNPRRAIACNVAGVVVAEAIAAILPMPLLWVTSLTEQCGVKNSYEDPAQLGADRWAALIGAHRAHEGACLVVNAGTATTIDVLDAGGVFQGGLILPGIDLMRSALAGNTAQLPLVPLPIGECKALPRKTEDAIASGCLLATAGAIERMFVRVRGQSGAVCLLSGGAVGSITPLLDIPLLRIDNLVLEGLACIGQALGE